MKRFLVFLILNFAFILPSTQAQPQLLDRVVAVVNDEIITLSELDVLLRPIYEQYSREYQGQRLVRKIAEARQKLLNQLIEDRLVFQEAKNLGIEVTELEVDDEIDALKKQFPDEKAMEEALKVQGMSFATVRDRIRHQIMVRRLHDMEIRSKVVVSPLDIKSYYEENQEEFVEEQKVKFSSITLKKSEEARKQGLKDEKSWQQIQNIRRRILQGEDFGDLAEEFSQDTRAKEKGLGDWVEQGSMIPVIDEVIFSLEPKQVSEIVETSMGYHIFRVEAKKAGKEQSFLDVRDAIHEKIFQEKSKKRFDHWLTELKRAAYISVH